MGNELENGTYTVLSKKVDGCSRLLKLKENGKFLKVPVSACVSDGDTIRYENNHAWVKCIDGEAQILPIYGNINKLAIDGLELELLVKEITEQKEFDAYLSLSNTHYRDQKACGRTSRLIIRSFEPSLPEILGYIELGMPLYMNKSRSRILDSPFNFKSVKWEKWDKDATRKYINTIVRVTRCVVYPEFRGLGLAQILLKNAIIYARDRWQVAGYSPYFLEIYADMLKYVPFAEKSGMIYIGETEGNLKRVYKDLEYLLNNVKRVKSKEIVHSHSFGMLDQQINRMNKSLSLMDNNGMDKLELLDRIKKLSNKNILKDYSLFYQIISYPKPTYMIGLNYSAQTYLKNRVKSLNIENGHQQLSDNSLKLFEIDKLNDDITVNHLNISYVSNVPNTKRTNTIQKAFGISPTNLKHNIIHDFSIKVCPGDIVLVTGPSGSGKTTLLNFFTQKMGINQDINGDISFPQNYSPAIFKDITSNKVLIEIFKELDVSSSLYLMGLVGLSDAFIYLKRYHELSKGQQYRVLLASLIASRCNIWIIDEFCSNLDPINSRVIANKLQKIARLFGITVIVASSNYTSFYTALKPDKIIKTSTIYKTEVLKSNEFYISNEDFIHHAVPKIKILPKYIDLIYKNLKTTTIRKGKRDVRNGLTILASKNDEILVYVKDVSFKSVFELTDEDAKRDGFESLEQLITELKMFYPNINNTSLVSIISFEHII